MAVHWRQRVRDETPPGPGHNWAAGPPPVTTDVHAAIINNTLTLLEKLTEMQRRFLTRLMQYIMGFIYP